MTPHLFLSRIFRGQWACCAKTLSQCGSRVYKPLPQADIVYGGTPAVAYKEWMKHFAMVEETPYVGSA